MIRRTSAGPSNRSLPATSQIRRKSSSEYPSPPRVGTVTGCVALLGEGVAREPGHRREVSVEGVDAVHEQHEVLGHVLGHVEGVVHLAASQRRHALAHEEEGVGVAKLLV